jgi:hypothetical protein
MYCVIQEIETKTVPRLGYAKDLQSCFIESSFMGKDTSHYFFKESAERFERTIRKAYKISLHESYREQGKVKKKQYSLCTVNYYDVAEGWFNVYDYCARKIENISKITGKSIDSLYDMIDSKTDPLIESIEKEFHRTEEYKTHKDHEKIKAAYNDRKRKFASKYDCSDSCYDEIYDGYGSLKNKNRLDEVIKEAKERREYEEKSRSYQEQFYSNYSKYFSGSSGSYFESNHSNHGEEDKETLKQFYRVLSKKFHPDSNPDKDTSKEMKLLNTLKTEWGL